MSDFDTSKFDASPAPSKSSADWDEGSSFDDQQGCGCGFGSCLIGCFAITLTMFLVAGVGGWFAIQQLPDWSRTALAKIVEDSPLPDDQKREISGQIDRVVDGYKDGSVSLEQIAQIAEEFGESPLLDLAIVTAADHKYVRPSGLDPEEKEEARLTLHRVTCGVHEEQIPYEDVEPALDYISYVDPNGNREFRESVSDEDLREMIAECKRLADEAEIPLDVMELNIAEEITKMIDEALSPTD